MPFWRTRSLQSGTRAKPVPVGARGRTVYPKTLPIVPNAFQIWQQMGPLGPWAAGCQLWATKGLVAPVAAKFGMYLGALAVFSGPVRDHVRPQAPALRVCRLGAYGRGQSAPKCHRRESKWAQKGSNGVKMSQNRPKMAQSTLEMEQNESTLAQNGTKGSK